MENVTRSFENAVYFIRNNYALSSRQKLKFKKKRFFSSLDLSELKIKDKIYTNENSFNPRFRPPERSLTPYCTLCC
jgi:hypothetical protein